MVSGTLSARIAEEAAKAGWRTQIICGDGRNCSRRLLLGLGLLVAAACAALSPAARAAGTVSVLYAGSLVNLMERSLGPAFDKASGDRFQGYAGGSSLLANQIKGNLRRADVFVSAAPKVNDSLMGPANGDWVSWYVPFANRRW